MDRTHPCGGCNVGSIPTGSTDLSAAKSCAPGARVRGTRAVGIEGFCGVPFSRMGRKTRAEKLLERRRQKCSWPLPTGSTKDTNTSPAGGFVLWCWAQRCRASLCDRELGASDFADEQSRLVTTCTGQSQEIPIPVSRPSHKFHPDTDSELPGSRRTTRHY